MPTSDFVLDLPPLTASSDAQDGSQAASYPVRCFSSSDGDHSKSGDCQSFSEVEVAQNELVHSAAGGQTVVEPLHPSDQSAAVSPSAEEVVVDRRSAEALESPLTKRPVDRIRSSFGAAEESETDDTTVRYAELPHEASVDAVASAEDADDDDDVDDVMLRPPVKPEVLEAVVNAPPVLAADQAMPQDRGQALPSPSAELGQHAEPDAVPDHALVPDRQMASEASIVDPETPETEVNAQLPDSGVVPASDSASGSDIADGVPVAGGSDAEVLWNYAESFVAMPQVSVASEVFQDIPSAGLCDEFQPEVQGHHSEHVKTSEHGKSSEQILASQAADLSKPAFSKAFSTVPANATELVSAGAEVHGNADDAESKEPMFRDLELSESVQRAVQLAGYDRPTAIQAQIIPHILEGRDVLAQSQTGTGKTAAFALPILSRLDVQKRKPQVLVLAPTRELAIQVANSFTTYGAQLPGFAVAAIYGGQDYEAQFRQLKRGVQVVVGTPGRVIDHINRGTLDLSEIQCLTLDEADEMLNMGFLEDVQFVLDHTPSDRQVALFSATLPPPIRSIAQQYLQDPVRITIKQKTMTAESIRQRALFVPPRDKMDVLARFLEAEETDGVIVFTRTKDATVTVADQLCQLGFSAIALNGDMAQKVRERTIQQLKDGQLDILVATDVAARGLDVTRVSHVFNFDVPNDSESYIHRIGRTGRAGRKGEAIIFLTNSQRHKLKIIERATRQPIEVVQVPSAEEINALRISRFQQKITDTIRSQNISIYEQMIREFAETSGEPLITIAAALAHLSQGGRPFLMTDRPTRKSGTARERFDQPRRENGFNHDRRLSGHGDRGERFDGNRNPRSRGPEDFRQLGAPEPGMDRYRIEVGRKDGVKPGNIVGAVANEGGIDGDQIGPIRIHDNHSTIDLPQGMPQDVFQTLQQTVVAGRQLRLSRDDSSADRGSSRPHKRPFAPRKPAQFSHSKKRSSGAAPRRQK